MTLLFSLRLKPVDDRSFVFDSGSGMSIDEASPPVSVLVGEPGVGGVLGTECAGELLTENEKEAFRGGTRTGRGALVTFVSIVVGSKAAFNSSTVCEFDRRKNDMKPVLEVVLLIGTGRACDGEDIGRSEAGVDAHVGALRGVCGGVACVLTMRGLVKVGGVLTSSSCLRDCWGVICVCESLVGVMGSTVSLPVSSSSSSSSIESWTSSIGGSVNPLECLALAGSGSGCMLSENPLEKSRGSSFTIPA